MLIQQRCESEQHIPLTDKERKVGPSFLAYSSLSEMDILRFCEQDSVKDAESSCAVDKIISSPDCLENSYLTSSTSNLSGRQSGKKGSERFVVYIPEMPVIAFHTAHPESFSEPTGMEIRITTGLKCNTMLAQRKSDYTDSTKMTKTGISCGKDVLQRGNSVSQAQTTAFKRNWKHPYVAKLMLADTCDAPELSSNSSIKTGFQESLNFRESNPSKQWQYGQVSQHLSQSLPWNFFEFQENKASASTKTRTISLKRKNFDNNDSDSAKSCKCSWNIVMASNEEKYADSSRYPCKRMFCTTPFVATINFPQEPDIPSTLNSTVCVSPPSGLLLSTYSPTFLNQPTSLFFPPLDQQYTRKPSRHIDPSCLPANVFPAELGPFFGTQDASLVKPSIAYRLCCENALACERTEAASAAETLLIIQNSKVS